MKVQLFYKNDQKWQIMNKVNEAEIFMKFWASSSLILNQWKSFKNIKCMT